MQLLNRRSLLIILISIIAISVFIAKPNWQIGGDGYGYYSYIRSLHFDCDLDFYNEFKMFDDTYEAQTLKYWATPIGKAGNPFAIGWSIFYAPFFILALILAKLFTFSNDFALSGFNFPYQLLIGVGTSFYIILGILLLFNTLKRLFSPISAWFSSIFTLIATPLIFYVVYEPSMSHGLSFFILSALFYKSIEIYKKEETNKKDVILLGLITGASFLIRWQNLLFIILPLAILWLKLAKKRRILSYLGITLLTILPQFFAWKHLYGSFLTIPQGSEFVSHKLELFNFLFSGYHGLFIWNPILFLALIGLILSYKKDKFLFFILFMALLGQILFNANLSDWFGGGSFGSRRMIGSLFIFAYGITYLLDLLLKSKFKFKKIYIILVIFILGLFSLWNYLLMLSTSRGILPINAPVTIEEVYKAPLKLLIHRKG
jgi:hypothetical protein